jgi:hypothetical protein
MRRFACAAAANAAVSLPMDAAVSVRNDAVITGEHFRYAAPYREADDDTSPEPETESGAFFARSKKKRACPLYHLDVYPVNEQGTPLLRAEGVRIPKCEHRQSITHASLKKRSFAGRY